MNNSTLRDKLAEFKSKVEEVRRLKEWLKEFEESEDIPPGSYRIGDEVFVVSLKKDSLVIQIREVPINLG